MAESANSSSVDTITQVLWSRLLFSIRSGFESPLNRVAIYAGRIIWRGNILVSVGMAVVRQKSRVYDRSINALVVKMRHIPLKIRLRFSISF